jgi:hypothetical protein
MIISLIIIAFGCFLGLVVARLIVGVLSLIADIFNLFFG